MSSPEPVARSAWKWLLPLVIAVFGLAGVVLLALTRPSVQPEPPQVRMPLVRVHEALPVDWRFHVHAYGAVAPRTESELVPQISGEVVWVSPALVSGGFFEAGDPLVRIDDADYRAELESARAAVARATSDFERARKERDRQRQLADRSVASQARIDDAENAYRVSEAVLREARARLGRAERDVERSELHAPYLGRVRDERVDVGQFVSRGAPIATLYAVDFAEVRLPIPDRELAFVNLPLTLNPGEAELEQLPRVLLSAEFAGRRLSWEGRIVRTEGEIDARSRMVTVVARVEDPYGLHAAENGDGPASAEIEGEPSAGEAGERPPLAVGLFVEAEIEGRLARDVFVLPRAALRRGEPAPGSGESPPPFVMVVDDDGRLLFRPVQVLRVERERVVVGAGLEPGARVCVSPLRAPVEGMAVRVAESPAASASRIPDPVGGRS